MKLDHPFIQLPLAFDAARLAAEVGAIPERDWRPHPQGFAGNSMLPLVAVNGESANERFAGPMRPTPQLAQMPYLKQVIASLGAVVGRTRLMRLEGQAEVTRHFDQGYYWFQRVRVHTPIVTQPSVIFECGDAAVNMAAGECWIFDAWRLHRVLNAHDDRRVHLVVDTVGGPAFWAKVAKGRPVPTPKTMSNWAPRAVEFDASANANIPLEDLNVPAIMSPWEVEAYFSTLMEDVMNHPHLPQARALIAAFVRDWRALWMTYGPRPEAKPIYTQTYRNFLGAMQKLSQGMVLVNDGIFYPTMTAGLAGAIVGPKADELALKDAAA